MADRPKHGLARGLTNYGDADFSLYLRRSFAKSMGYSHSMLERPVVGIAHSASGYNNCHRHFPELIDAVKRGLQTRIGFEDTLTLPDGSAAASNRDLVAVALRLAERFEGESGAV